MFLDSELIVARFLSNTCEILDIRISHNSLGLHPAPCMHVFCHVCWLGLSHMLNFFFFCLFFLLISLAELTNQKRGPYSPKTTSLEGPGLIWGLIFWNFDLKDAFGKKMCKVNPKHVHAYTHMHTYTSSMCTHALCMRTHVGFQNPTSSRSYPTPLYDHYKMTPKVLLPKKCRIH